MNRITAVGLVSLVAWGVLVLSKYADFVPRSSERAQRPAIEKDAATSGVSMVLPVTPEPRLAVSLPVPNRIQPAKPTEAALEFRSARDLRTYSDGLSARRAQLNADERYHLAKTLEECLFVASMNEDLTAYAAKQRRLFLANLPAGDPTNTKRIAAFEASDNTQRCARFQGMKISQKDIDDLYDAAAAQGDARAQARLLVADMNRHTTNPTGTTAKPSGDGGGGTTRMEGTDFSRLIGLMETRDPEAMMIVGSFLASSAFAQQLRIGPNGEVPEPSAFLGAFSLVACDFGPDCIALNREALNACAFAGYCNAQSFEELYQNFLASPWAYSQAMRYRSIIHEAINSGNWALIGLIPKSQKSPAPN